jgi:hypothetical protein
MLTASYAVLATIDDQETAFPNLSARHGKSLGLAVY